MDLSSPITLLIHDGELEDIGRLLQDLGASFVECTGAPSPEDARTPWDLVIATPRRLLDFDIPASLPTPVRIAVLSAEGRTLRKLLERQTVEFSVRRPVHPEALRLLILHALYQGPEKRGVARVSVGAPVRFRDGWRWCRALLVDLSEGGCHLIAARHLRRGDRIWLRLPAALSGRRSLRLRGRVVRWRGLAGGEPGRFAVAVSFQDLSADALARLRATVDRYASGPATLAPELARRFERRADADDPTPEEARKDRPERGVRGDRRSYSRRVIALGDAVARVLIGRDLSLGGMRIDPQPSLAVGDALEVALHVRAGEPPLVVSAVVCRDDSDQGLALRFRDLSPAARSYLGAMVNSLPHIEAPDAEEAGAGLVVSEILADGSG